MKGVTVIGHGTGETLHICDTCWEGGAKRIHQKTVAELKLVGLDDPTTILPKGPLTHCDMCKGDKRMLN